MNIQRPYFILGAESYGTGTYDCGEFDEGCAAGTTTTTAPSGGSTGTPESGSLVNTGYNVIIPVAIGAALIIAAAALLITKMLRKRKTRAQA